ncbi:GxxExxY protein [Patescibacteria group bacterium]
MEDNKKQFVHSKLSYQINGILFEVFNTLGPGLKERTYQRAIAAGLKNAGLKFSEEVYFPTRFQGEVVGSYYFDFIINDKIILELKVGDYFSRTNLQQVHNYLLQSGLQLGIIANFTHNGVKVKRVVNIQGSNL